MSKLVYLPASQAQRFETIVRSYIYLRMTRTMILSSTVNFATQAPKPAWRNPYEYSATEKYVFELVEFWQCVFFQTALIHHSSGSRPTTLHGRYFWEEPDKPGLTRIL